MKNINRAIAGILMIAYSVSLVAQGPGGGSCTNMHQSYSSYENESASGNTAYTAVVTDGYGSCTNSTQQCSCNATHTPMVSNILFNSSTTIGGSQTGTGVCPNCYLSYENDQNVALDNTSADFTFRGSASVACSLAGLIYTISFPDITVGFRQTHVVNTGPNSGGYCPTVTKCYPWQRNDCPISAVEVGGAQCSVSWECASIYFNVGGTPECYLNVCLPSDNSGEGNCGPMS